MYSYSLTQWIIFFFWYCFLGWIWECFYVSMKTTIKTRKWKFVNRGFLHGPLIPIYGFAAITILLATIQLRQNTLAVYIIGAVTATLFELVTGTFMERTFKVKYWDYSNLPLNYKGHICLIVSLFWGFFSVLLVQIIHKPIEEILLYVPIFLSEMIAVSLSVIVTYDFTISFNEAMDLRNVLESLSEHNETVKRLERRFDTLVAFTPILDMNELRELKLNAKENIIYKIENLRCKNEQRINQIKEHLQLPEFEELADRIEILEKLETHRKKMMQKSNQQFFRAMNQLKRNPGVKSEKYQEMLDLLNELLK